MTERPLTPTHLRVATNCSDPPKGEICIAGRRPPPSRPLMTVREVGVAACLLDGLSNKEIVRAGVAPNTKAVENCMRSMRKKLGCRSGRALIAKLAQDAERRGDHSCQ